MSHLPESQPEVRQQLNDELQTLGLAALHSQLQQLDPDSGKRIHPNDTQRTLRALEVYRLSGQTLTELTRQRHGKLDYPLYQFAIAPAQRSTLHERIAMRFDQMLAQPFQAEVEKLYARTDLNPDLPSIRSVGYRQMWAYLAGDYDYSTMREKGIIATRQLAKRQLTWLRGWPGVNWLQTGAENLSQQVQQLLAESPKRFQLKD